MTIGPAPMMRMELMSVRFGISCQALGVLRLKISSTASATYMLRDRELAAFALGITVLLQLVALPVLLIFNRKTPKA